MYSQARNYKLVDLSLEWGQVNSEFNQNHSHNAIRSSLTMDTCSHYENVTDDQKPKRLKLDIYLKQVTKKCDVKRCTEEGKRLQDFGDGDLNSPRNFDVALSGELLTLLDAFAVLVVAELLPTPDFVQLGHLESFNS